MIDTTNTPSVLLTGAVSSKPNANFLSRYQVAVPSAIEALTSATATTALSNSFQPGEYDVVCGRGKGSYNRPGNKRFRDIVIQHIPEYQSTRSKLDKSMVLNRIIDRVRQQNNGTARFVKNDKKKGWFEISDDAAREKVGHAMREAIAANKEAGQTKHQKEDTENVYHVSKQTDLLAQQQQFFSKFLEWTASEPTLSSPAAIAPTLVPL